LKSWGTHRKRGGGGSVGKTLPGGKGKRGKDTSRGGGNLLRRKHTPLNKKKRPAVGKEKKRFIEGGRSGLPGRGRFLPEGGSTESTKGQRPARKVPIQSAPFRRKQEELS